MANPFHSLNLLLWALRQGRVSRLPPRRVAAIQRRRLRRLLKLAVRRSPFYARKFRGIDVGRCDLRDLPTTDKDEVMAHFDEVVTDRRLRLAEIERFMAEPDNARDLY